MTDNKYEGINVTSSRAPATPEPAEQPAAEPQQENVVVPYQPSEPETEQPTDLNQLVDHLQRENVELKALVTDRDAMAEAIRDAVHNPPAKPPIDPRKCSTADYIANKDEIRKSLGIRSR